MFRGEDDYFVRNESFWDFRGRLESVDTWPMMSSPYPMLAIFATYLLYVLKIGPEYMKNKQPYNLKDVIVIYNAVQVIVSAYIVYLASKLSWNHGWISKTCLLETEETRDKLTTIMYYYHLAKLSEILDTIFFILRKKFNQVTFLHVYHHAMMIVTSWVILKYEPTYPTLFIRNINSFVHVVMYTYYMLSSFPSLAKYLWWKKYITSLQLVQFTLVLIHFTLTYFKSECTPSNYLCVIVFWNTTLLLVLFSKFYVDTYKKNPKNRSEIEEKYYNQHKNGRTNMDDSKEDYSGLKHMNVTNSVYLRKKTMLPR